MNKTASRVKKILDVVAYALAHKNTPLFSYNQLNEDDISVIAASGTKGIIPRTIWIYWEDENLPDYIRRMVNRMQLQNPDHSLILLNAKNLSDYIPPVNFTATDIPLANKSDIIRLEILATFGGIWIDASTLFYHSLAWVHQVNQAANHDLIGFYRDISTTNRNYPVIESWFLCVPPDNPFIRKWLDILSPLKELGARGYYHMIQAREDYAEIAQKIHKPDYLLVYLAQQIAQRQCDNLNLYLKRSEANAFLYQEHLNWDAYQLAKWLCLNNAPLVPPPLIKLNSANRSGIESIMRLKLVNKNSIIGDLYRRR
ncbi:capsular polysaccharide synthesis protein [Erwiniaceae bacterium BAC15a-03b]|uniref:Capsular polysaccharide synthesis protein n=1 Tax=Winslowiella arboricola TaxID=2978220 RepID=A0A9J6PIM3_9GAMM|nr:capsular polysaccharide synthesis protein [Winslowiella arboricola]MCU5771702.1 capsular polysaccharide synthesis protein [Winslowiella arboricola]MCU5778177.1 capsular polysaccharide synthesis protein [Winslowiella arboricola]